ncbi:hypothetical protein PpBr36_03932, partial [Pyricularia pennisetigena]|uniref:hypothetical protein n=1 Tax=Pyricularia pennisetigena TaxID=1578925 RepID=UPI00114EC043
CKVLSPSCLVRRWLVFALVLTFWCCSKRGRPLDDLEIVGRSNYDWVKPMCFGRGSKQGMPAKLSTATRFHVVQLLGGCTL